jgi:hypothetical protein
VGCRCFLRALLEGSGSSCRPGRHKPIDVCFAAKKKKTNKGVIVVYLTYNEHISSELAVVAA